jgi:hypothetical protein
LTGPGGDAGASSGARPGAILPQNWRIRRMELRLNRLAWPRAQALRRLQAARSSTGLMAPDSD